jgi:hypothetical protein
MNRAGNVVFLLIVGATLAAAALAGFSGPTTDPAAERSFHHLVGGLGFGPAVDLARCEFAFDPRLCPACSEDTGPIPGGLFFCPYHASSVLNYSPLK